VLVAPLLVLVSVVVLQLILAMHARNVLALAASEGARAAALAGSDASMGVARARGLLASALSMETVDTVTASPAVVEGLPVMQVRIRAHLPLVGLPLSVPLDVTGHALREGSPSW
jgi:Flp pilus assembly protein TadG